MIDSLLRFSIERRFLVLFVTLGIVGLGAWAYQRLPIDAVPDITNVQVQINSAAAGFSPLETEQRITFPIETAMAGLPGLQPPPRRAWAEPSLWLYSVLIDPERAGIDRDGLAAALAAQGIEARSLWCPAHLMEPYRGLPRLCGSVAEGLFARGLSLPSSVGLTDEQRARVIDALRGALPAAR